MTLWYNAEKERYGVLDVDDTWYNDGLHCGACFDILLGDDWLPVRLEYTDDGRYPLTRGWYLFGPDGKPLPGEQQRFDGLQVRK